MMATAAKSAAALGAEIIDIPLDRIIESEDNPRKHFDAAFVAQLAASLVEVGQITPALVRPHPTKPQYFELVAGATRFRAAKQAERPTLRCVVEPMDDVRFLKALTFENLKRRDLRPLEEARGYALLMKRLDGYTPARIAHESGVSVDYVRDRLRLLQLVPDALALLDEDPSPLPLSHALELAKLTPAQQQEVLDTDSYDEVLWHDEQSTFFPDTRDSKKKGRAVVTLNEFRSAIAEHFPIDPASEQTAELFPELAEAFQATAATAAPFALISDSWSAPNVKKGEQRILSNREWKRADGSKGAPKCKESILGIGVHGRVRGHQFAICIAKDTCTKHYKEEIEWAARQSKAQAQSARDAGKPEKEQPYQREARLRREAISAMRPALPKIMEALRAKVATANGKPSGPLAAILLHQRSTMKPEAKKAFPDDLLRQMAYSELVTIQLSEYSLDRFRAAAKALGVELKALVKAHGKQASAKKAAPKKAGTKAKSKAASRA